MRDILKSCASLAPCAKICTTPAKRGQTIHGEKGIKKCNCILEMSSVVVTAKYLQVHHVNYLKSSYTTHIWYWDLKYTMHQEKLFPVPYLQATSPTVEVITYNATIAACSVASSWEHAIRRGQPCDHGRKHRFKKSIRKPTQYQQPDDRNHIKSTWIYGNMMSHLPRALKRLSTYLVQTTIACEGKQSWFCQDSQCHDQRGLLSGWGKL